MYSISQDCPTIEEAGQYIREQLELYKAILPVDIKVFDNLDRAKGAWFKTVSITFNNVRGKDVRQIRRDKSEGTQG